MSEVLGRLNRTIEAQGPDALLVQARDALAEAYQTIAELHEKIAAAEVAQTPRADREALSALSDMPTYVDEFGVRYGRLGERTAAYIVEALGLHEEYAIVTYYSAEGIPTYYPMRSREEALEWKRPWRDRIPWEQYPVSRLAGEWTRLGEEWTRLGEDEG